MIILAGAKGGITMPDRQMYSIEQLQRLINAHKLVCQQRGVDPLDRDGRDLAARLLTDFGGDETEAMMLRRFAH